MPSPSFQLCSPFWRYPACWCPWGWRVDLPTPRRSDDAAVPPARACQQRALLGLVGGYPIGAQTAADLYRERLLTEDEATRLLTFATIPIRYFDQRPGCRRLWERPGGCMAVAHSPALSSVGRDALSRRQQYSATALLSILSCRSVSLAGAFVDAVKGAATSMLAVCGFITLFYVLAQPFAALGGYLAPALVGAGGALLL